MTVFFPYCDIYVGEPYYGNGESDDAHGKGSTVSASVDSATLTADSDDWSTKVSAGAMIVLPYANSRTPLFVSSVGAAKTLTMTGVFKGTAGSGLDYVIDAPVSTSDWRIRIYPSMRQISGDSSSMVLPMPFQGSPSTALAMPFQTSTKLYHIDGEMYIDSCNRSGCDTVSELIDALEELLDNAAILGLRWYDSNLTGGATAKGVILKRYTWKDGRPTRSISSNKWHTGIQLDVQPCKQLQ